MENVEPASVKRDTAAMAWLWMALCAAVYLATIKILAGGLPVDETLSNLFFTRPCLAADSHSCWTFNKSDWLSTFLLHTVPARIFVFIAVGAALVWLGSFKFPRLRPWRALSLALVLGIGGTSALASSIKHATGHYCPSQLGIFDGPVRNPPFPEKPHPACFPAAHPSPGFGLMVLYFAPIPLNQRRLGLCLGIATGGFLGVIQIMRGEHYLSHVLASAATALFIGALLHFSARLYFGKFHAPAAR